MSRPVHSIEDDEPLVEAVRLMKEKEIRHLAVTEDQTIVGVLSVSDLLRYYSGVWWVGRRRALTPDRTGG
ncbi:MAG: CBS domain-containing protein [Nitrospirales bacterium]